MVYLPRKVNAQIYPTIYVTPDAVYSEVGKTFNVSVIISNVRNLFAFQVYFSFSNHVLEVTSIEEGQFLNRGYYDTAWTPKIYNDKGYCAVWNSLFRGSPAASGSGELFKIIFKVKKPGGSVIHLYNTKLADPFQAKIEHNTKDGLFTTVKLGLKPEKIMGAEYTVGTSFQLNLTLKGAIENFYGFDVRINYNNTILNATSVTLNTLLEQPNINFTEIVNEQGEIHLNVTCLSPASPTNNTGLLATITFEILKTAETEIGIAKSNIINVNGESIIHLAESSFFSGSLIRDLGIIYASLASFKVTEGENVTLNVIIGNLGKLNETFNIRVYAMDNISAIMGINFDIPINAGTEKNITMQLSTIGLNGNYTVVVQISYVPNEIDLTNNQYILPYQLQVIAKTEGMQLSWGVITVVVIIVIALVAILGLLFYRKRK